MTSSDSALPRLALLPGDGIGREITAACQPIIDLLPVTAQLSPIGWDYWCRQGDPIPPETWSTVRAADAIVLGAITSKPPREAQAELAPSLRDKGLIYRSPIVTLRRELDLFANVRPVHLPTGRLTIIRENTEGLYGHDLGPEQLAQPELSVLKNLLPTSRRSPKQRTPSSLSRCA